MEQTTDTLVKLVQFYEGKAQQHYQFTLNTVKACFQLNLACLKNESIQKPEVTDTPMITLLKSLATLFKDQNITSDSDCYSLGINLYLNTQDIKTYDNFTQSQLARGKLATELLTVYSLLLVSPDIGSKHFESLLSHVIVSSSFSSI